MKLTNINSKETNDLFESFLIYGENGYLSVKKIKKEDNHIYFSANKIISKNNTSRILPRGIFEFNDNN